MPVCHSRNRRIILIKLVVLLIITVSLKISSKLPITLTCELVRFEPLDALGTTRTFALPLAVMFSLPSLGSTLRHCWSAQAVLVSSPNAKEMPEIAVMTQHI